jgi:hypothetical protein
LIRTWVKRRPSPRAWWQFGGKLEFERELLVGRQRFKCAADCLGNILNGVIGEFEHKLASLDLGQIQHVIDEPQEMLAVGLKAFEYAKHLFRWLTVSAVRHQFGIAQDGVERRAQLVAHIGEELRFMLARLFKLPALVLDLVEQPRILDGQRRLRRKSLDEIDSILRKYSRRATANYQRERLMTSSTFDYLEKDPSFVAMVDLAGARTLFIVCLSSLGRAVQQSRLAAMQETGGFAFVPIGAAWAHGIGGCRTDNRSDPPLVRPGASIRPAQSCLKQRPRAFGVWLARLNSGRGLRRRKCSIDFEQPLDVSMCEPPTRNQSCHGYLPNMRQRPRAHIYGAI